MRYLILAVGLAGLALFGGAFAVSYLDPLLVERGAREVVRLEVERRVGERIDALSGSRIAAFAESALARTDIDIEEVRRSLRADVPAKIAEVVTTMLDADCACRKRLAEYVRASERRYFSSLVKLRSRLTGFIESTYASVAASLLREFRIFTGSNGVAFLLLAVAALVRRRASLQLLLPAVAVVGAVAIVGGLYVFQQDWLHTVVYGQYVGFAYSLYLAVVALLLADILLHRARMTTRLVNAVLAMTGSAASAVPC